MVFLGLVVMLYPTAASWLSAHRHASDVTGMVTEVESLPRPEKAAMLATAEAYNAVLSAKPPGDADAPPGLDLDAPVTAEYLDTLGGTAAMARLQIPEIGVDLPVYHGTDDETLARGIGHLFGTSLPIGGTGTHAVLLGHSGVVGTTLFDNLHQLTRGDRFTISVLDKVLTYEVDQILTVEPTDTDALRIAPDHDYVTLVTCTPVGVNSHRLLVRGTRVETTQATSAAAVTTSATTSASSAACSWSAPGLVLAGAAAAALGALWLRRRRASVRRTPRDAARARPRHLAVPAAKHLSAPTDRRTHRRRSRGRHRSPTGADPRGCSGRRRHDGSAVPGRLSGRAAHSDRSDRGRVAGAT